MRKFKDFERLYAKADAMRDVINQHIRAAGYAIKHFATDSAINVWNMVAGDDIRTLAGNHPLSAKIVAGIDLAANVTLPEEKAGVFAAKEAAKVVEHLGVDAAKDALEKGLQHRLSRIPEPAFYDGKFQGYRSLKSALGSAGENRDWHWHHGVPQKLKDYGVPVHEINNVHGMYRIHSSDHVLVSAYQGKKYEGSTLSRLQSWGEGFEKWRSANSDKPIDEFLQNILKNLRVPLISSCHVKNFSVFNALSLRDEFRESMSICAC